MSEYDTKCLICSHYDHYFGIPYEDEIFFKPMCWTGKMWLKDCPCRKHVTDNLEYLEWLYDKKHKKSKKF